MPGSKEDFKKNNAFSLYNLYGHTLAKGAYPICPTCSITKTRPLKRKNINLKETENKKENLMCTSVFDMLINTTKYQKRLFILN